MNDTNRNMILAIVLSIIVLFGWQFFVAGPQMERAQREAQLAAQQQQAQQQATDVGIAVPNADGTTTVTAPVSSSSSTFATRDARGRGERRASPSTPSR